ncbi:hypothetical protein [Leptospira sp. GIMC2001]|uniref:hypothetical protein n=1 Tax=Leptospira sp. GIMC2001 TaxID=1513297 RepID=UPI00234BF3C1|nr:hypothetical protein [Leptospira sp. GIMC2001]WCL49649.1 hypothetical protein O4O04_02185 [Leptospira sp. GIMC2001]
MDEKIVRAIFIVSLLISTNLFSETNRIYFQYGSGHIYDTAPIISPGIGLASIFSYPAGSIEQIQLLPISQERKIRLRTEYTTIGVEKDTKFEDIFFRFGFTNTKFESNPYNPVLNAKFFSDNFNPNLDPIDPFQRLFVYTILLTSPEYESQQIKSGMNYEANMLEFGTKIQKDIFGVLRSSLGVDLGLGFCSIRDTCTAYSISPFIGLGILIGDTEVSVNLARKYIWLEYGVSSFYVNLTGVDNNVINFSISQKIEQDVKQKPIIE